MARIRLASVPTDMTIHKDPECKKRLINRHKKNENWSDPKTAGFDAKRILWNKPTLQASVADLKNIFFKTKRQVEGLNNFLRVLYGKP